MSTKYKLGEQTTYVGKQSDADWTRNSEGVISNQGFNKAVGDPSPALQRSRIPGTSPKQGSGAHQAAL